MIPRKLTDLIFSQLLLLLLPAMVLPVALFVLVGEEPMYESRATIWVDRTLSGSMSTFGQSNPYQTPATNQAQTINDLLATRSFRRLVAVGAGLMDDSNPEHALVPPFRAWAGTIGVNLVTVTARSSSPDSAEAIVSSVLTEYGERARDEARRQGAALSDYYTQQLPIVEAELATREAELAKFLAENPSAAIDGSSANLTLDYRTLVNNVESQQTLIEDLRARIQSTALTQASIEQNQSLAFQVQDQPNVPDAPLPISRTQQLGIPLVGLLFGTALSSLYVLVRYRTDHTIKTEHDVAAAVPVLGSIQEIRPPGFWWRLIPGRIYASRPASAFARRTAANIPQIEDV